MGFKYAKLQYLHLGSPLYGARNWRPDVGFASKHHSGIQRERPRWQLWALHEFVDSSSRKYIKHAEVCTSLMHFLTSESIVIHIRPSSASVHMGQISICVVTGLAVVIGGVWLRFIFIA